LIEKEKRSAKSKAESKTQYINETELRSLILRINNRLFVETMSNKFKRLDKYILKYKSIEYEKSNRLIPALVGKIKKIYLDLLTCKSSQLLLLPDEDMKNLVSLIHDCGYNLDKFNVLLEKMHSVTVEMVDRARGINSRKSDYSRLDKYMKKHIIGSNVNPQKYKRILREKIMKISYRTIIDRASYERFGEMVLLIIKNILKKPKFSGYSYRDEFYSDSTNKIFRYLRNFNHKMISSRSGQEANAFSYISQYVHNSIIHIINTQSAETQLMQNYFNGYNDAVKTLTNESSLYKEDISKTITVDKIQKTLYDDILLVADDIDRLESYSSIKFIYPAEYKISLEEYEKLKELNSILNINIQIQRR